MHKSHLAIVKQPFNKGGGLKGIAVLCALLFTFRTAQAQQSKISTQLLSRMETAFNKGDIDTLKSMTAPDVASDYSWTRQGPGMLDEPRPWQVKVLELPAYTGKWPGAFIVVTKYHPAESVGDHIYKITDGSARPLLREEIPETDTLGFRVRDHKLTVHFNIPGKRVAITDHVTIENQPSHLPATVLRINAIYAVSSIKQEGKPLPFRQAGGFITFPSTAAKTQVVDLAYSAASGFSKEDYILSNQAGLTSYWYPHTGRLPSPSEVKLIVPKGWQAIGQGELLGKSVSGNEAIFSWKNKLPVCYLTVAAGAYTVTSRKSGDILVSAYLLRHTKARAEATLQTAIGAVSWFSKNFSPFPYSRFAVVETDSFPAALECYSFTLAKSELIPIAIVHEIAHTWWGGIVPNTYTRSLWNESFAEYSDGLYCRRTGSTGLHEFNTKAMTMIGFSKTINMLQARDAMDAPQSFIGYGKGSLVLENLERMMGTPKMLTCMRNFIKRHNAQRAGEDAEWPDFVDAVAETAGEEWREFFPAWLTRTDLPRVRLKDVKVEKTGQKYTVSGFVTQDDPAFWIQVPLTVKTTSKDVRQTVNLRSSTQPFKFELSVKPVAIALDPERESLREIPKSSKPPTLLNFQTDSGAVLVVYSTGGSSAEQAAVKNVAHEQTKQVMPFATLTVKADRDVTESDIAGNNVLLIGRMENFHLPVPWQNRLPLRFTDGGVSHNGQNWMGKDLWGLEIVPHPTRPEAWLAHAAGASPGAIRNFKNQADLNMMKCYFIVRGTGQPLLMEEPKPSGSDYITLSVEEGKG
jgi:hypothetical protein